MPVPMGRWVVCAAVCVCVCILCILAVLYLLFSSYVPPLSSFAGGTDGYVFGGVITGCIVFISCIVIVTRLRVWLMARKRSRNVEAAQTNPTNPDPPFPNDEDPPEYLPPPEGDQQQTPL